MLKIFPEIACDYLNLENGITGREVDFSLHMGSDLGKSRNQGRTNVQDSDAECTLA